MRVDGAMVGDTHPISVGEAVGRNEGTALVGSTEGGDVGIKVGLQEGLRVGAFVGA